MRQHLFLSQIRQWQIKFNLIRNQKKFGPLILKIKNIISQNH